MKMTFKLSARWLTALTLIILSLLVACTGSQQTAGNTDSASPAEGSGAPAMVDSVTVEKRDNQFYATVVGNYPDPCTAISAVNQVVDGSTITITLLTASPPDVMCAAVLTPFTADILLTTGGLVPQEYSVVVNEAPATTLLLQ